MQKVQESKIKMARATSGVLESNTEIVSATPGLSDATVALNNLIEETGKHSQGQMETGTELTAAKNAARAKLVTAVLSIRAAVAAHATVSTDPEVQKLKDKYQGADSEVKKMRDMPLFSYAYVVYDDALSIATQLEPFASEVEVVELKNLADNFNALLPQKRTQLTQSTVSTQNLEEVITRINLLLTDTIDVLVKPWEYKEPDFFKAYSNARVIVDAASRKKGGDSEEPTDPA
jgi:hypothetical protein